MQNVWTTDLWISSLVTPHNRVRSNTCTDIFAHCIFSRPMLDKSLKSAGNVKATKRDIDLLVLSVLRPSPKSKRLQAMGKVKKIRGAKVSEKMRTIQFAFVDLAESRIFLLCFDFLPDLQNIVNPVSPPSPVLISNIYLIQKKS